MPKKSRPYRKKKRSPLVQAYQAMVENGSFHIIEKTLSREKAYKKEEYADKMIDYPASPTKKAYIGVNKLPLMKAAKNGFGFQGVLLQDETREYVQCHSCGKWMQKIAHFHLKKCCGLTVRAYKIRYGLWLSRGLVSDETSLRLTKACLKNVNGMQAFVEKWKAKGPRTPIGRAQTMARMNMTNTCPEQIKRRLYEFIRINRELPSQGNRGRSIYKVLRRRFESWSNALIAHRLPALSRNGTNMEYAFADGTVYKYNINKMHDREALYHLILKKCPEIVENEKNKILA